MTRTASVDGDRERLERYLRRRAADGEFYFKSRFIADELEMSPRKLGRLVARLSESTDALHIEEWAYAGATTWRVVAADADASRSPD